MKCFIMCHYFKDLAFMSPNCCCYTNVVYVRYRSCAYVYILQYVLYCRNINSYTIVQLCTVTSYAIVVNMQFVNV
jgi:hypothetical protein